MLATTIQITNNPPHTTHTNNTLAGCAGNHHQQAADANTVLNVNPTVCLLAAKRLYPTHTRTHTHHPTTRAVNTCRHKKTNPHANHNRPARTLVPHNGLPRKEVIQPHLPVRLPCYDFVPIANPTFDHSPHQRG